MKDSSKLKPATLVFLRKMVNDETYICLAEKKRGFGAGKWNGAGGKIEKGESIEQAAIREISEELSVKLVLEDLQQVATIDFLFTEKPEWDQRVFVFFADYWQGEPTESEEMRPQWFKISELPYDAMWEDDKYWLPRILGGEKIQAEFHFDSDQKMISKNVVTTNLHELVL